MEVDITGRHFDITESLKAYVGDKIQKLEKYSLKVESIHVVLSIQKFHHVAEITLLAKGLRLTAREDSIDMYSAFDKSMGNIELQVRRQHDRLKDHKGRRYEIGAQEEAPEEESV